MTERQAIAELAKIVGELCRDTAVVMPAESNYYVMLAQKAAEIEREFAPEGGVVIRVGFP